ncbi:MAG: hypothetical protein ACT4PV_02505 [Planctomycetaceae bacterium]
MRTAIPLLLLALGFLSGYFVRGLGIDPVRERSARDAEPSPAPLIPSPQVAPVPAREAPAAPEPPAVEPPAAPAEEPAGEEPLAEMMRAQIPMMKSFASAQSRERAGELLTALNLDPERADRLAQALANDAARQIEAAFLMMFGEGELDPDVLASMQGVPAEVSQELEGELARFLSPGEIVAVREHVKRQHARQQEQMVEMQVALLDIPDLSPDQGTRVRALFRDTDSMHQDTVRFAEMMRVPGKMRELFTEEGIRAEMERQFAPRRERMRQILTQEQMARYGAYEERMAQQALMAIKMFGGRGKMSAQPSSGDK